MVRSYENAALGTSLDYAFDFSRSRALLRHADRRTNRASAARSLKYPDEQLTGLLGFGIAFFNASAADHDQQRR